MSCTFSEGEWRVDVLVSCCTLVYMYIVAYIMSCVMTVSVGVVELIYELEWIAPLILCDADCDEHRCIIIVGAFIL